VSQWSAIGLVPSAGVLDELLHRVHARIRDLRSFEPPDDLVCSQSTEDIVNNSVQSGPIGDPIHVRVEARIGSQIGTLQDGAAEPIPLALVLDAQIDRFAVAALERSVGAIAAWLAPARPGASPL